MMGRLVPRGGNPGEALSSSATTGMVFAGSLGAISGLCCRNFPFGAPTAPLDAPGVRPGSNKAARAARFRPLNSNGGPPAGLRRRRPRWNFTRPVFRSLAGSRHVEVGRLGWEDSTTHPGGSIAKPSGAGAISNRSPRSARNGGLARAKVARQPPDLVESSGDFSPLPAWQVGYQDGEVGLPRMRGAGLCFLLHQTRMRRRKVLSKVMRRRREEMWRWFGYGS